MAMSLPTKILLIIPNLGLGGAQRVFHDYSVELTKHYAITETVFNLEGGDLYPSGNPVVSLDVSGERWPSCKIFGGESAGCVSCGSDCSPLSSSATLKVPIT